MHVRCSSQQYMGAHLCWDDHIMLYVANISGLLLIPLTIILSYNKISLWRNLFSVKTPWHLPIYALVCWNFMEFVAVDCWDYLLIWQSYLNMLWWTFVIMDVKLFLIWVEWLTNDGGWFTMEMDVCLVEWICVCILCWMYSFLMVHVEWLHW